MAFDPFAQMIEEEQAKTNVKTKEQAHKEESKPTSKGNSEEVPDKPTAPTDNPIIDDNVPTDAPTPSSNTVKRNYSTTPKTNNYAQKSNSKVKAPFELNSSKKREGRRELFVESLFVNRTKPFRGRDGQMKTPSEPFSFSARFRFRLDVEGDKGNAGGYVTNLNQPKFPHEQHLNAQGFKSLLEANGKELPSEEALGKQADSHRPLFRSDDNLAINASVFYAANAPKGSDNHPVDYINPKTMTPTEFPFDMNKERKIAKAGYRQRTGKSFSKAPHNFASAKQHGYANAKTNGKNPFANVAQKSNDNQKKNPFAAALGNAVTDSSTDKSNQKTNDNSIER